MNVYLLVLLYSLLGDSVLNNQKIIIAYWLHKLFSRSTSHERKSFASKLIEDDSIVAEYYDDQLRYRHPFLEAVCYFLFERECHDPVKKINEVLVDNECSGYLITEELLKKTPKECEGKVIK